MSASDKTSFEEGYKTAKKYMEKYSKVMKVLGGETDSTDLYKGIFWITDVADLRGEQLIFRIPVTPEGVVIDPENLDLNSKNVDNYNHRLLLEGLPSGMTHNKIYNYYPRGRVEIRRHKATIYLNPNIATEDVMGFLIDKFGLTSDNGITDVIMKADGSDHYKCHLD